MQELMSCSHVEDKEGGGASFFVSENTIDVGWVELHL